MTCEKYKFTNKFTNLHYVVFTWILKSVKLSKKSIRFNLDYI